MGREVGISPTGFVGSFNEVNILRVLPLFPVIPKPFAAEAGDGENPPVEEDSDFSLIVPRGQRPTVDRGPCRRVFGEIVVDVVVVFGKIVIVGGSNR